MTELQKKLDMAYMQLQQIAVSGGGVKHLALAMQMLEDAFKLAAGDGETEDKR